MSWGPWIDHNGCGAPNFRDGQKLWLSLADPEEGMDHYDDVVFVVGETFANHRVYGVTAGGSSWVLPVTEPGRLYVYRYRIWQQPGLEQTREMEAAL